MVNHQLKEAWEKRATEKGSNINSVLFQGLPDSLNKYIHDFHWNLIQKYLVSTIREGGFLLDLGCGYGRLSELVKKNRNDLEITGMDLACNYCAMYRNNISENVICGNLEQLPFRNNSFDGLMAVTSLMYVDTKTRIRVFKNMIQLLKPGGKAVFVDPGEEFKIISGILKPSAKEKSTGGYGFTRAEYLSLANIDKLKITNHGGMPFFSLLVPLLLLFEKIPFLQNCLLTVISVLDEHLYHMDWFSLHRWIVVERNE